MSMLWTATYALDRGKACQETRLSRGTWVWYCMLYDIFLESERYNTLKLGITPLKVGISITQGPIFTPSTVGIVRTKRYYSLF